MNNKVTVLPLPEDFDAAQLLHNIANKAPKKAVVVWVNDEDIPHVSYCDDSGAGLTPYEVIGLLQIASVYVASESSVE